MWRKDPFVAIDLDTPLDSESILTPNVVALPTGGYRMYYTGRGPARNQPETIGYILSARSDDGETWQKEPGIRIDVHPPTPPSAPSARTSSRCPTAATACTTKRVRQLNRQKS